MGKLCPAAVKTRGSMGKKHYNARENIAGQGGIGRDRPDSTRWGLNVGQGVTGRCSAALSRLQQKCVEAKMAV